MNISKVDSDQVLHQAKTWNKTLSQCDTSKKTRGIPLKSPQYDFALKDDRYAVERVILEHLLTKSLVYEWWVPSIKPKHTLNDANHISDVFINTLDRPLEDVLKTWGLIWPPEPEIKALWEKHSQSWDEVHHYLNAHTFEVEPVEDAERMMSQTGYVLVHKQGWFFDGQDIQPSLHQALIFRNLKQVEHALSLMEDRTLYAVAQIQLKIDALILDPNQDIEHQKGWNMLYTFLEQKKLQDLQADHMPPSSEATPLPSVLPKKEPKKRI